MMAERIQRKRTKGWRMPEGAVYVGRPTKWGNPFPVKEHGEVAVEMFDQWLGYGISAGADCLVPYPEPGQLKALADRRDRILGDIGDLRGKDLVCWCHWMDPCHADVLLEIANGTAVE
jgi:hypothetical protein